MRLAAARLASFAILRTCHSISAQLLAARHGENYALHEKHLNHQLARVLKTIGFDRFYVRGEGCYLFDAEGERYLDFLSGFGVYALGRSHPAVKAALHQALDLDLPNMVQMDCALLPGLLAEQLRGALPRRDQPGRSSAIPAPRRSSRPSSSPGRPPAARGSCTPTTPSTG